MMLMLAATPLRSGLLINEVVTNAPDDWAELYLHDDDGGSMDISGLFVTMYYGTNERIADGPVTLYGSDRPGTPWDDRFAVVHPAVPGGRDETDEAGDLNGNGIRDLFCNNYYASYWNSDCVVAIDTDDDPSNGGIVDFTALSNRDGSPNETIASYIRHAVKAGHWRDCGDGNIQLCCVDIGPDGLAPHMAVSRKSPVDTGGPEDFTVTSYQTPGRPNISVLYEGGKKLAAPLKKRIVVTRDRLLYSEIPLFIYQECAVRFSLFSSTGREVYRMPFPETAQPGFYALKWHPLAARYRLITGLYIGRIEAVNSSLNLSEEKTVYVIMDR